MTKLALMVLRITAVLAFAVGGVALAAGAPEARVAAWFLASIASSLLAERRDEA